MSWDQTAFLTELTSAVDAFDRERTAELCQELIDRVGQGQALEKGIGRKVLAALRKKCFFDLIEKVATAFQFAEVNDHQIQRQYAQALIDQGKIPAALNVLELLELRTTEEPDPEENAEARGLVGRVYKQQYVNEVNADRKAVENFLVQKHLKRAFRKYNEVYRDSPAKPLWHGINTVALLARAAKDKLDLESPRGAAEIALEILHAIEGMETPDVWALGTAMEACVALDDFEQAWAWLGKYIEHPMADAFELSSTARQLREVWGLTVGSPPGASLLPVLTSEILKRRFGRAEVPAAELAATIRQTRQLEKEHGWVSLSWYRLGLERARGVAQIKNENGDAVGTGFLIRGSRFDPAFEEPRFLLTNAHVVSDQPIQFPNGQRALLPGQAVVAFEAEATAAPIFRVAELLWTSPPGELDATLLKLDHPVPGPEPYPIADELPARENDPKVYVVGHPLGGGLSITLSDNALLAYDDQRLHYRAPTAGGSSGSPVFDSHWRLIGLHHAAGKGIPRLDGQAGTYDASEGIQIGRILAEAREKKQPGPRSDASA